MAAFAVIIGGIVALVLIAKAEGLSIGDFASQAASDLQSEFTAGGSLLTGNLSSADIAKVASSAGFEGDDLATAVAVALAESSGNPSAVGDLNITPGGSIGLWQVNLKAHPEYSADELTDPQTNANAAFAIYQAAGGTFRPWSTFNSGAYLAHLDSATAGAQSV